MPTSLPPSGSNRLLTVREAAQLLGLCLDSVRRQLRSGKLPGVRVGRGWRVPERVLMAQLGLMAPMLGASSVEEEEKKIPQLRAQKPGFVVPAPADSEPRTDFRTPQKASNGNVAREQTKALVEQAAQHADLSKRATERLLAELDDLLQA